MSQPSETAAGAAAVEMTIQPKIRDLGDGFEVRRVLPVAERRMVGPFVFFDQFGPTILGAGKGLDVRPHPHIGLATVTYLLEGEILHRDSLGSRRVIQPGAVNWMTAGRGIAHSERTPPELRRQGSRLSGVQLWVALPKAQEETAPAFHHHDAATLPEIEDKGLRLRVIAGSFGAARSPVATFTATLCAEAEMAPGSLLAVPAEHEERAVFPLGGDVQIGGRRFPPGVLLTLRPGGTVAIRALAPSRLLLLGGATMDGPRHVWWNFVSSRRERIEQAKADWKAGRFAPVVDETEFIPLPD